MPFTEVPHSGEEFSNKKPDMYDVYEKFRGSELNLPECPTLEEMREIASILEHAEKSSRSCQKKPSLEFPIKLPDNTEDVIGVYPGSILFHEDKAGNVVVSVRGDGWSYRQADENPAYNELVVAVTFCPTDPKCVKHPETSITIWGKADKDAGRALGDALLKKMQGKKDKRPW